MKKSFDFEASFAGRMKLLRIERHISQSSCTYDLATGILVPPPPDHPLWIVERLLVGMEKEFWEAKERARKARNSRERRRRARRAA